MSLEASTLGIVVRGDGIESNTKALEALARAGDKAEKSTAKLSQTNKGAEASAKKQEALWYDLIDKASKYYEKQFNLQQKALQRQNQAAEAAILREAQQMNAAFDKAIAATKAQQEKLDELRMKAASKAYADAQAEANRMNRLFDRNQARQQAEDLARVGAEYRRLAEAAMQSRTSMRGHNQEMENAHALVRGLSGSLGALWLTYGNILPLIAGAAIGAAIKEAVSGFAAVQYQMTFLKALTEDTTTSVKTLTTEMHKVAGELGIDPESASKGLRALAQAGLDTKDALSTLPQAFKLATVGELPLESAALAGISVMNAYGKSVRDFESIGDIMAKAGAMSAASVTSMTESFKYSAGTAEQYGVSLEKLATVMTMLGKRSITGSSAGVAANNLIAEVYSPSSQKAIQAQAALGVKAYADGSRKALEDVIQEIKDGLTKYDAESQGILLEAMFGKKGGKAFYAVAQQTKEQFREMESELEKSAGFTANVYRQSLETIQGQLALTKSAISNMFSTIGEESEGPIKSLLQTVRSFANDSTVKDAFVGLAQSIKTLLTVGLPLAGIFGGVWAAMKVGTAVVAGLSAVFARMAAINLVNFFAQVLASVTLFVEGIVTMNATILLSNPIFLAITGLVAGLGAAYLILHRNKETAMSLHETEMKNSQEIQANLEKEVGLLDKKLKLAKQGVREDEETAALRKMDVEDDISRLQQKIEANKAASKLLNEESPRANDAMELARQRNIDALKNENKTLTAAIAEKQKSYAAEEALEKRRRERLEELRIIRVSQDLADEGAQPEQPAGTQHFDPKGEGQTKKKIEAYKQEMLELQKLGASYNAKTEAVLEFYRTGSKVAADSQQAIVEVNRLSGKYASNDMYLKALGQAKIVDEAKFRNEKAKTFVELTSNMQKIVDGEDAFQKAAKESGVTKLGYYARQVEASKEMLGWTDKEIAKARELAIAADEVKRAEEARAKLTSAADSARTRAGEAQAEIDSLETYGVKVKVTALDVAKLAIEKAKLTSAGDAAIKNNLLEAATLEQLNDGYRNLLKQASDLNKELQDVQAEGIGVFADSEQAKIKIAADAAKKRAKIEYEAIRKAADQEGSKGSLSEDTIDKLTKAYQQYADNLATIDQIADQKTNNVKLKDWKKTVDDIESIAREGFFNLSQKGVSLWSSMLTTFKSMFKTTVMDYIYKQFAKPLVLNVVASVAGSLGMNDLASAAGAMGGGTSAAPGGTSSLLGAVSAAKGLYTAVTTGFAGLSDTIAGGVQSVMSSMGYTPLASQGLATASGQALTPFASSVGAYAAPVAAAVASYYVAKAISGGYKVEGIGNILNFAGPVGGLVNRAFGMGSKETTSQGIRGTISDSGVTGESYSKWKQDGGWFRSDKSGTNTSALGVDIINTLASGMNSLKATSVDFAKNVGISSDALKNYSKTFDITLGTDAQANQEAITKYFTEIGDDMAKKLIPGIAGFGRSGETAAATLERLSTTFKVTNDVAYALGKTSEQLFGALGLASEAMRSKLVDLSGGADALSSKTATYISAIYTDAEKLAPVQKAVSDAMSSLGFAGITTKAQFKSLVDGLDLTNESNVKLFNSLLDLAPAFGTVAEAAEATKNTTIDSLTQTIDKLKQFSNSIKQFRDGLATGDLSTLTPEQKLAAAASQYQNILQKAMAGDENAQGRVTDAAQTYLQQARDNFASGNAYTAIFDKVNTDLSGVSDWADKQVSDAQKQIDQLQGLNNTAVDISNTLNGIATVIGATTPVAAIVPVGQMNAANVTGTALSAMAALLAEVKQAVEKGTNNIVGATVDSNAANAKEVAESVSDAMKTNQPTTYVATQR